MNAAREALTRAVNRAIAEGAPVITNRPAKVTLTRMGDFYEAFGADADTVADILRLVVSKTRDGRRACGVPAWRIHNDVARLADAGVTTELV